MKQLSPLFTWRSAICDSDLAPATRHVALTLSLHMSERGDSAYPGGRRLSAETGLTTKTVYGHLQRLESAGWLTVLEEGTRGPTRLGEKRHATKYEATLPPEQLPLEDRCNHYSGVTDDADRGNQRPGTGVVVTEQDVIQDDSQDVIGAKALKKRKRRLPGDFTVTPAMRAWASEKAPKVDVDLETDNFRDHHTAKGSVMDDWTAAWRTWIRNAAKWARTPAAQKRGRVESNWSLLSDMEHGA